MNTRLCLKCDQPATRKGLCNAHYMQEYRRKRPTYTQGVEVGRCQILDALNAALEPHGGSAYVRSHTLYVEIQGHTLSGLISYSP